MSGLEQDPSATRPADVLAEVVAAERLRVVSTLIRVTRDWDLAEDCVQEAAARAAAVWPERGIPDRPGAWLTTVAKNLAIDALRSAAADRETARRAGVEASIDAQQHRGEGDRSVDDLDVLDDDRLRLIFTCCHPALSMEARVALTLRTVLGLTVAEAAAVFLVPEPTMQKRLVRARAKIREAGIPYRVPPTAMLPERTSGVLAVLYLLFSEGYASSSGGGTLRPALAEEAIRLTRLLAELLPQQPEQAEVLGLLALQLFQHSRADARFDAAGELVPLDEQDRSRWSAADIAEGARALATARALLVERDATSGPYLLQAMIAAEHATAPSPESTRFAVVVELYEALSRATGSPVVDLNRVVAVARASGADAALALLDTLDLDEPLARYHLLHATRADLHRRLGERSEALRHYRRALEFAPSEPERRFLRRRIAEVVADDEGRGEHPLAPPS